MISELWDEFTGSKWRKQVDAKLSDITKKLEKLMGFAQEELDYLKKIGDGITKVVAAFNDLKSQIKNSMTDAEVAQVHSVIDGYADALNALVPPVPPPQP